MLSKKGKVLLYSLPSVGPGADPIVQAVSPQVTLSHPPGGRLPLLSAKLAVSYVAFIKRLCIPRRTLWRYTNVVLFIMMVAHI